MNFELMCGVFEGKWKQVLSLLATASSKIIHSDEFWMFSIVLILLRFSTLRSRLTWKFFTPKNRAFSPVNRLKYRLNMICFHWMAYFGEGIWGMFSLSVSLLSLDLPQFHVISIQESVLMGFVHFIQPVTSAIPCKIYFFWRENEM